MLLIILSAVVLALLIAGITLLNARRKSAASGDADSDSQAFVGGVLNALFTVVLAFYIVFAWQNGDDIDKAAKQEVNALTDTHWQVSATPGEAAAHIRSLTVDYANRVTDHEWAALDRGDTDPETDRIVAELRGAVLALPADDEVRKSTREQALQNVRALDEAHRERVDVVTGNQTFNLVLLGGSVLGAALMLVFPLLIGLSMRPANVISMVLLTLTLGFTVYVSFELLHPLHGPFGVDADAFGDFVDSTVHPPASGS